jgi:hypothetical protein
VSAELLHHIPGLDSRSPRRLRRRASPSPCGGACAGAPRATSTATGASAVVGHPAPPRSWPDPTCAASTAGKGSETASTRPPRHRAGQILGPAESADSRRAPRDERKVVEPHWSPWRWRACAISGKPGVAGSEPLRLPTLGRGETSCPDCARSCRPRRRPADKPGQGGREGGAAPGHRGRSEPLSRTRPATAPGKTSSQVFRRFADDCAGGLGVAGGSGRGRPRRTETKRGRPWPLFIKPHKQPFAVAACLRTGLDGGADW